AQARGTAVGNEDAGPVAADLVGNAEGVQLADDAAAVGRVQVAVQDRHLLLGEAAGHEHEECEEPDRYRAKSGQPRRAQPRHRLKKCSHRLCRLVSEEPAPDDSSSDRAEAMAVRLKKVLTPGKICRPADFRQALTASRR